MIFRIIGSVLFVVAMSAFGASPAFADNGELHIESSTTGSAALTGEQTTQHAFQITPPNGPSTKCNQALFEGTVLGKVPQITSSTVSITATYTGCTAFGIAAQVKMNGCKYTITGAQPEALTALVDITGCTAGKQIEVVTAGCTITVPEQSGLSHVTFESKVGPPEDVVAQLTVTGIKYELHGVVCGHATTALTSDGTYSGKATFRAYEDEGTEKATHNGHEYDKVIDGKQVELTAT